MQYMLYFCISSIFQIIVVAGGWSASLNCRLDTTEMYSSSSEKWTVVGSLPASMSFMSAVNLNENVYLIGLAFLVTIE